ncbi:MAG: phosphatidylserine decarboxylase [Gammaproteobacteria bacterium]|nr:phosphatidylserine decarboxylase [Gammaproteobacteria bacterium]
MDKLKVLAQYLLPQHGLSQFLGWLADRDNPPGKDAVIGWFIKRYGVDMSEAAESDPRAYASFNAFFTRELKAGARPMQAGERELACPVDGAVSQVGTIADGRLFQAKGHSFSLETLLGGSHERALPFQGGEFANIYLSPKDYHRVHMPWTGTLREMVHVPGKLFSVNPTTVRHVPELFAVNERVVALFDCDFGPMALVLVGATVVGSVETVWHGVVTPPSRRDVVSTPYEGRGIVLEKGAEMGRFRLGSTVIAVVPKGVLNWHEALRPEASVRLNQVLASRT